MLIAETIFCCIIGYMMGNLSPSYLIGKRKGYDVRVDGSGNAGASNTFLLVGAKAFLITAIIDIMKAFAAYRICQIFCPHLLFAGPLAGGMCVIGHMYPAILKFQGGKGLASLGGIILAWDWRWFLILLLTAIIIVVIIRYICVVAPAISILFPACYYWRTGILINALILLVPAVPIIKKHWNNFVRIKNGKEMRVDFIWKKEEELKRVGKWNDTTIKQLERRGK